MAKTYKGSLSLEWYNKQKSILLGEENAKTLTSDIPSPKVNWINKDEGLYFEIHEDEGKGLQPYWVAREDIRIKEARPLIFQKGIKAVLKNRVGTLPGTDTHWIIEDMDFDDPSIDNILIKGDNLLALNTLKKHFENKPEIEKVKCIYIDPPYNTGAAFESYDDNLAKSQWLTMFRDRIVLLRELLRNDGILFINFDDNIIDYASIVLDEIFGNDNRFDRISVKTSSSQGGFGDVNPGLISNTEYILIYAKNKPLVNFNEEKLYIPKVDYDENYQWYITNIKQYPNDPAKWQIANLNDIFYKEIGISPPYDSQTWREAERILGDEWKLKRYKRKAELAIINKETVFRTFNPNKPARYLAEKLEESKNKSQILIAKPESNSDIKLCYNGEVILFYKSLFKTIDGEDIPANKLTTFWDDISWEGIAKEGGVKLRNGKKPERLIKRIIEISSNPGDIILDCFCGSGTTLAVANKMNRKWIGVEIGSHCDTLIIKRLKSVLQGTDSTGISQIVKWGGGGSFKYYHLGDSIITFNENGVGDFNWVLGKKFIEESLLLSYDYKIDVTINLKQDNLFKFEDNQPTIGLQYVGSKKRVAVIALNEPKGEQSIMSYDEIHSLYKIIKSKISPEFINIFTNRGVEIAYDSKPDDLEIIKVPHAIFAELEK